MGLQGQRKSAGKYEVTLRGLVRSVAGAVAVSGALRRLPLLLLPLVTGARPSTTSFC